MSIYSSKPLNLNKDSKCIRCEKLEKSCNFQTIPYSYFIMEKELMHGVKYPDEWPTEV